MKVYRCAPEEHDRAGAWISHLPVLVSTVAIAACEGEPDEKVLALARQFASSGFRDTSRVGGNPELGLMMAQYNREALIPALQGYRASLERLTRAVEREDWVMLEQTLLVTQAARPQYVEQYLEHSGKVRCR
ncbi:MAG: prephenate dehydrogenase dimerization domain-containing protein [Cyanobacteria bacterium J06641_5]